MKQWGIWIMLALAVVVLLALVFCQNRGESGPKREAVKGLQALEEALRNPAPEALLKASRDRGVFRCPTCQWGAGGTPRSQRGPPFDFPAFFLS